VDNGEVEGVIFFSGWCQTREKGGVESWPLEKPKKHISAPFLTISCYFELIFDPPILQ